MGVSEVHTPGLHSNTIIEALEFVLENTIIKTRTGELLKQEKGIPMGDSLSPGIAVGTTAWMLSLIHI